LKAEGQKDSISISWLEPLQDGGEEIRRYTVYRGPSSDLMEPLIMIPVPGLEYLDTDVVPGEAYFYKVTSWTDRGEGPSSEAVSAIAFTVPTEPNSLDVSINNSFVELTWAPPTSDGGRPVILYRIYRGTEPDHLGLIEEIPDVTSYLDISAQPSHTYYYRVSAVNQAGEGLSSNIMSSSPSVLERAPGPVVNLRRTVDGTTVILSWDHPVDNGSGPLIGYEIWRGLSPGTLISYETVDFNELIFRDEGLVVGETYHYSVYPYNDFGRCDFSKVVDARISEDIGPFTWGPVTIWLIASVVILGVVGGTAYVSEPFKFSLVLLVLPLFSRLRRDDIMDNKNRYFIHGLIIDRPGIHYSEIMREFGFTNGVAAYHLSILEKEDFIRSVRDGRFKRFYSKYTQVPREKMRTPEEVRWGIIDHVKTNPGCSQKDIVDALGISRDSAGYFLREMVKEKKVDSSRKGKYTIYFSKS
jgi:predicted transcriptional regulator